MCGQNIKSLKQANIGNQPVKGQDSTNTSHYGSQEVPLPPLWFLTRPSSFNSSYRTIQLKCFKLNSLFQTQVSQTQVFQTQPAVSNSTHVLQTQLNVPNSTHHFQTVLNSTHSFINGVPNFTQRSEKVGVTIFAVTYHFPAAYLT